MSPAPKLRITCCLCAKLVPAKGDVYLLDGEWARRYPRMQGRIACLKCALRDNFWTCRDRRGNYAPGHVPPPGRAVESCDAWNHIAGNGTQKAMVCTDPDSGMIQGGEEYLRWRVQRWGGGTPQDVAAAVRAHLDGLGTPDTGPNAVI
jgi:hypothetical protein